MYNASYFKEHDPQVVITFMQQHPFAMLIGVANDRPVATQVPLLIETRNEKLFLSGHIMKNTDHHKAFQQNNGALCVFTGPHAYVSASWYTRPQTASTWNYMSVHARGELQFLDEKSLLYILEKTTALFENNPASPASFHQLPAEYIERLLPAIVAFEMEVQSIDHVFKLSQNRDAESYQHITEQLQGGDESARQMAEEMKQREASLFKKE